jgi:similar to spore coat protein
VTLLHKILETLTGTDTLTDEVIAMDCLFAAKSAVRMTAAAITEATTYEVRTLLQKQLDDAIGIHEAISNYMKNNGWYHPYDVNQQIRHDLENAQTSLNS